MSPIAKAVVARVLLACALLSASISSPAEPVVHAASGISFPDEIDGFQRTEAFDYEAKQRGLGFSYGYKSSGGGIATVYVYTAGLAKVPTDLSDPLMSQLREHTIREIHGFAERLGETVRQSLNPVTLKMPTDSGAVPVFLDSFIISSPRSGSRNTWLFLWPSRGHFMKIRVTAQQAADVDPKQMFAFVSSVIRLAQ